MGICQRGVVTKIPYLDFNNNVQPNPATAPVTATVSLTNESNSATFSSGVLPPVGSAVSGTGIPDGTIVESINRSTIVLARKATSTRSSELFWGFPPPQVGAAKAVRLPFSVQNRFTGTGVQCDLQSQGMTIIYVNDIQYQLEIIDKSVMASVSFFGNDFGYKRTAKEKVYPPGIVKNNTSGDPVFFIHAASYHP
jgi:hypothetical protein